MPIVKRQTKAPNKPVDDWEALLRSEGLAVIETEKEWGLRHLGLDRVEDPYDGATIPDLSYAGDIAQYYYQYAHDLTAAEESLEFSDDQLSFLRDRGDRIQVGYACNRSKGIKTLRVARALMARFKAFQIRRRLIGE